MILRDPELEPPAQKSASMEPPQRPKPDDWDTRKINTFSTFHGSSNSHLAGLAVGRGRHAHSRSLVLDTPLPAPARPSHGHSRSLVVDMPVRIIHGHSRSLVEICPDTPISSSSGSSGGGSTEGRASERTPRPLSRSSARLSGKDAPLRPLSRSSGSGITISCGGGGEGSAPPPPPRPVSSSSGTPPPPTRPVSSSSGTPPPLPRPVSSSSGTPPPPRPVSSSSVTPPPPRPVSNSSGTPPPLPRPVSSSSGTPPPLPRSLSRSSGAPSDVTDTGSATGGSESAAGGPESAAGGIESAAGGSESATGDSESAAGGHESAAGGPVSVAGGSESAAGGGSDSAMGGSESAREGWESAAGGSKRAEGGSEDVRRVSGAGLTNAAAPRPMSRTSITIISSENSGTVHQNSDTAPDVVRQSAAGDSHDVSDAGVSDAGDGHGVSDAGPASDCGSASDTGPGSVSDGGTPSLHALSTASSGGSPSPAPLSPPRDKPTPASRTLLGSAVSPAAPTSATNGGRPQYKIRDVRVTMGADSRRFGFSVIGGADEGIRPKIDDVAEGSPADKADLEVGDEILEVNGRSLENATHTEVISHIHQCIRSRTICLRVKRKAGNKLALDLAQSSNVQDAFVIAVEQQARERLEKLSALRKIKPVDMTRLSQQLSDTEKVQESSQLNGIIESNSVYVTSVPALSRGRSGGEADGPVRHPSGGGGGGDSAAHDSLDASGEQLELNQLLGKNRAPAPAGEQPTRSQRGSRRETGEKREPRERREISEEREKRERRDRSEEREKRERREKSEEREKRERREKSEEREKRERREKSEERERREKSEERDKRERREKSEERDKRERREKSEESNKRDRSDKSEGRQKSEERERREKHERREAAERLGQSAASAESGHSGEAMSSRCNGNGRVVDDPAANTRLRSKAFITHNDSKRSSKESLSSHKSSRSSGARSRASSVEQLQLEAVMSELDRGPHREMAVDVPESFVARTKTPPRYPPPRAPGTGTAPRPGSGSGSGSGAAPRPEPPAPAPRPSLDRSRGSSTASRDSEPGREQMERIRKYQEDIRRDREMRDKRSKEEEFLRSSLRGSEKMKRLEHKPAPTGFVNNGYDAHAHDADHVTAPGGIELAELLASLKQIQRALKASGAGLQQELAVAQSLLTSPEFQRVLAVHNKVQEIWCFNAPPSALCFNAQDVAQEVVGVLQESSSPEAVELVDLLTRFDMEGLLYSHDQIAARGSPADSGEPEPAPALDDYAERVHHYTDPRVRVIRLEKTNEPLGATVKNEGDSVLVGRIVKGGAADKSGLLRPGDEILEVNGIEMRGKSVDDVCDILAGMTGSLVFLALPRDEQEEPEKTKPPQAVLHVKAHFDYDPEDDIYMPCREIGMSFQKGDILHVTSQEDPDWWQATRDGDEDLPLSGLIPSLSFQTQRETLKQSIIDSSRKEGKKNKFLCAKRTNKKKRKMYNAEYNDDYEANEILTYEEVGLYYPRANHKRPVVLIGPPNIGRHELRQKLMEDTERFSAAVPHTSRPRKDTEVDGQDYHFISRPQFEQDIVNRLFVEHGEYERAYYGTSVSAIRTVVNSSKICVLNLHPHSLKILKTTDLKPFVVFVAPPSLEKLRQLKQKAGEQVRDDELKQIIEKAREIEEVYGHYFDIVIINSDLNRAYEQLIHEINTLEREPQWVPASWLRQDLA